MKFTCLERNKILYNLQNNVKNKKCRVTNIYNTFHIKFSNSLDMCYIFHTKIQPVFPLYGSRIQLDILLLHGP